MEMIFLSASQRDIVQAHSREILIHNRKDNPNYWCSCLPNKLRKEKCCGSTLCIDYVTIFPGIPSNFQDNRIDLVPEK